MVELVINILHLRNGDNNAKNYTKKFVMPLLRMDEFEELKPTLLKEMIFAELHLKTSDNYVFYVPLKDFSENYFIVKIFSDNEVIEIYRPNDEDV